MVKNSKIYIRQYTFQNCRQLLFQYFAIFKVYEHSLGTEAEKFGPLSIQVEDRLRGLDEDLRYFMDRLRKANMEEMVNIVLVSLSGKINLLQSLID